MTKISLSHAAGALVVGFETKHREQQTRVHCDKGAEDQPSAQPACTHTGEPQLQ